MYNDYYGYDTGDQVDPKFDPHVNEVDVIFERDDDGAEFGLTVSGTTNGPSAISDILEAVAIHDVNTSNPLQGTKEVLQKHDGFDSIRIFRGNSEMDDVLDLTPEDFEQALPRWVSNRDRVWHLRLDYPGKEIAIKHPDGPAVLRGPFNAPSAKELSTTFFTQLTQALDHFAPTACAANALVVFDREKSRVSGVRIHMPQNGPDALSCVLSWLKETDRSIVGQPEKATTGLIRSCKRIGPIVVPFDTEEDLLGVEHGPFSNDCPVVVVDCPAGMLRLQAHDASILAEAKLHKTGAGQIRKGLHQVFRERGISMAPDYHNRYGWQREDKEPSFMPF